MNKQLIILLHIAPFALMVALMNLLATFGMYKMGFHPLAASLVLVVSDLLIARQFSRWYKTRSSKP